MLNNSLDVFEKELERRGEETSPGTRSSDQLFYPRRVIDVHRLTYLV